MCGICGIWYFDPERSADEARLRAMTGRLAHRGPDGDGLRCAGSVGFGFRRLKVIDPAGSPQPITSEDGRVWLVCNGEIYNFRSLRRMLAEHHSLATGGDAEVIAHLYEDYGAGCVYHLRGMFAFALWDERAQQMMLAVDRFGKKPLYYWLDGEKIVFGSEIKALLAFPGLPREIDPEALDEYLACGYISAPRTIYRAVRRLPAGHTLTVQRTGDASLEAYWQPVFAEPDNWDRRPTAELTAELRHLLAEAVRLRMTSDVPVGAFLSGGVDSSAVVALMRAQTDAAIKTFSVGFEEIPYDERGFARQSADACRVENYADIVTLGEACDLLPMLVRHFDEPFADSSMIPTYVLSRLARKQVTVALSGDGGDELFAGYHRHLYGYRQQYLEARIPLSMQPTAARAAALLPHMVKVKPYLAALGQPASRWNSSDFFSPAERSHLLGSDPVKRESGEVATRLDRLSQLQQDDLTRYLPGDILVKVDRASMLASLEVRSPLLDHTIFEFMARVPPWERVGLTSGKALLRRALGALLPPVARQRRKQGFSIPQAEWLRGSLLPLVKDVLMTPTAPLNRHYVRTLIDEHVSVQADHKDRLWALLCYELWVRG